MPRPPRVFLSRTTAGLAALAEKVAAVLRERGFEIIHQPDFGLEWRKLRHMLMEKIRDADAVLCLVGPTYGFAPRTTIPEFRHPDTGREEFSYTQLEYLIARRLHKPAISILVPDALCTFARPEDRGSPEQQQLQSDFIRDFIKKDDHVYHQFSSEADLLGAIRSKLIPIPDNALPPPSPENIPLRSIGTIFTGRAETLRALRESLVSAGGSGHGAAHRPAVHLIHGTGGVGKTRVTVEYAHAHEGDYTARLFVRGGSPGALDESLASLAGLFILNLEEQDEKETEVRIAAVLRWLAAHPGYLLVVDNVDTDDARDHAIEVLARLPAGHVLITSRLHRWPGDILRTPLDVLSDTDSRDLLLKYRSSPKAPAPDTDAADALALAHDLDGLALALEQAAAYLNVLAITIAEYHERWKTNAERVREWHDPAQMGYPASVATTWLTSFEQLAAASQALLNLLSWLAPDPIPRFLLKPLAAKKLQPDPLTGTDPYKALGEIIHFSLANPAQNGSAFAVHRLIQQVTRERQEPSSEKTIEPPQAPPTSPGFFAKLFGAKLPPAAPVKEKHPPAPLRAALEWVNAEMPLDTDDMQNWPVAVPLNPHVIAVATFAADRSIPEPSGGLFCRAAVLLLGQANHRAAEPLLRRSLAISEVHFGKDHPEVTTPLNNLAQLLQDTNRRAEAEPLMRRALAMNEATFGQDHPKVAISLNNLAALLAATNRLAEAEPLLRRALAMNETALGPNHPKVAVSLNNLAQWLQDANRLAEAEPLMRRALAIDEANCGQDHRAVAGHLNNLAQLLQTTNRHAEAEPLLRRSLAVMEDSLGNEHPDVAISLNNLAQWLQDANRLAEAEPLMRRGLAIDEASFGQDHPNVAIRLNNLAQLLQDTNRFAEAEPLMRRALAMSEASDGPDHPDVATNLNNLARLLRATHRLAEAEPLLRRALAIFENSLAKDHPKVASPLNNLAALLMAANRPAEAEPLMRRALAIDEASYGQSHPDVARDLNNLAQLLQGADRFAEAEPLMRRALAITEASQGKDHPAVAISLNNLARLLQETDRLAEAEPPMRRALAIFEDSVEKNHPNVASQLNNLAALLMATNRQTEAEPLLRRALAVDEAHFGQVHPDVARDLNNLAQVLQDTERLAEAEPLMRRALAVDEAHSGPDHPDVVRDLNNLAHLLQDTHRLAEAEPLIRRALAIREASFGPDHPDVARDLNNLAALLHTTKRHAEAEPLIRRALAITEASHGQDHPAVAIRLNNLARLLEDTHRLAEAEPLMRRTLEILLRFTRDTGQQHPHLAAILNHYDHLLTQMGHTPEQVTEQIRAVMAPFGMSI